MKSKSVSSVPVQFGRARVGQAHKPSVDTIVLGQDSTASQALPCQGLAPCKCSINVDGVMMVLNHAALCLSVSLSPAFICEPPKSKDSCLCAGLIYSGYMSV